MAEEALEKVWRDFATVGDLVQDTHLKLLAAEQEQEAAQRQVVALKAAMERAGGDLSVKLKDIAD